MLLGPFSSILKNLKIREKSLQEYVVLALADTLDEFTNKSYVSNHISYSGNINFITLKLPCFTWTFKRQNKQDKNFVTVVAIFFNNRDYLLYNVISGSHINLGWILIVVKLLYSLLFQAKYGLCHTWNVLKHVDFKNFPVSS